ncbi:Por secretion system protein [uncultured Prevotella sp.]|uniref:type IX secretion system anionic LPS delivery protein PorZ n=1 Tax=uncultured Prevotella sp. TaxID=159272 RepID=UPI002586CF77|nr:Por secretion system protein [uncultured Prevotella sp.]
MKRLALLLLLIAQLSIINCQLSIAQIGTWRAFMSYYEPQQIIKAGSNTLFVRASNSLYSYHLNDHSITTYDKVNTLSDTYISYIAWSQQAKRLIITYQDGNIDLMDLQENVINISGLYNKLITGDKNVSSIRIDGIYAYLICGFGIVKVNMQRAEITDSYKPSHPEYPTSLPEEDNSDYDRYIDLVKTLKPDGPQFNYFGFMIFSNNRLYGCNGDFNHDYPIQILNNNAWTIYQHEGISEQTGVSFQGAFCLDVDPSNPDHIFAGSRNGLYEYLNGQFIKYYDNSNSPIEPFDGVNKDYQLVTGTKFDSQGNLWFLNSSAPTTALVKYHNGTFTKLNHSELMKLNTGQIKNRSNAELSKMIIDSKGKMWFANNNWVTPAIYQYDLENDKITAYENFVNQDGIIINIHEGVRCVVEDLEQNIWVGTSMGLLLLEKSEIENNGNVFTQVKVPRNDGTNNADYLLANVDISSIAIDGGNRKWIGTLNNGVYLISADNMTQIHHFTTSNSKLLSNAVLSIAINPTSGEVFFATDKGLCSYVSDATAPNTEMTTDNVRAYPNPVEPGYSGPITISGLSLDADVKILTTNGVVVNQGRSNGGTYVWDGCDQKGRRVASGIYMVATATSKGEKGTVCKIAIVR